MPNDFESNLSSQDAAAPATTGSPSKLRFGIFDLDLENYELRRRGLRIKLQQKPFQILGLLVAQAGRFVTRGQLARHLWPDLHVNFDRSLNTAMNTLRRALGDSPDNPRFIETRAGLGYRFIAPVEVLEAQAVIETSSKNQDAYHDYLKGRYFQNKMTEEDLRKSVAYFEAALKADPDCAAAQAGLADTQGLLAYLGIVSAEDARHHARHFAMAALRFDDRLAESYVAAAGVKKMDWDWAGSEADYRRAAELKPSHADGHRGYAALLSILGRHAEAIRETRRAQQLDPLSLVINADAAWTLYMSRDYQGAMEQAWRTLAMEPRFAPAQHTLGLAWQQMGMLEEAIVEFRNARTCSSDHPAAIASLGHAYAAAGQRADAEQMLRDLERLSESRHVSGYWTALLHFGIGDSRKAVEWLEHACDARDVWLPWLSVEPRFDALRAEGKLDGVLGRVGLLPSERSAAAV
jgi:DNA-binding winged helix-turn-helix (wHTH) protein/Flp pilus assembly protein TadD